MPRQKTVVMVPKGAEFKAVQRGVQRSQLSQNAMRSDGNQATKGLDLISLPVGPKPVEAFLTQWCLEEDQNDLRTTRVVVMGLCGSLTPKLTVGDTVLYRRCINGMDTQSTQSKNAFVCSTDLPLDSANDIISSVTLVTGVTKNQVVSKAADKCQIGKNFQAEVVDMEGGAILNVLAQRVASISILRVVSDDSEHDLPNLSDAFDAEGNIRPWVMTSQFLGHPAGAIRLIRGSLAGLKTLEQVAQQLASHLNG